MPTISWLSRTGSAVAPNAESTSAMLFRKLLLGVSVLAGLVHVGFIGLFHISGVTDLAVINVASVLCYVLTYLLLWRGQVAMAWWLIAIEVVGHAVLAVHYIGWSSGFHYYIILIPPIMMVSSFDPWRIKAPAVVGLIALYLALDIVKRTAAPAQVIASSVLDGLHYVNVTTACGILVFLAGTYYRLVRQSEVLLREMASIDSLTRLYNRGSALAFAHNEAARLRRDSSHSVAFVLADLDHFKSVNDTYGHDGGDAVLRAIGKVLKGGIREIDHAARWGGEEFLLVLPGTHALRAAQVAERLREAVANVQVAHNGRIIKMTITLGISVLQPNESVEQAIARADQALYAGKKSGRNRVELAANEEAATASKTP